MRRISTVALGSAFVASVVFVDAASAETTLRFNRWLPPTHNVQGGVMVEWAKNVEAATEGRVKIAFTASSLGPPPRQFDLAREGVADVVLGVHAYTPARFPLTQMVELPFQGSTGAAISAAYWDVHHRFLEKAEEHKGVVLLALWVHGPGAILNGARPVTKLADLSGMKLRVAGGLMTDITTSLGAVPIQAAVPQIYEILSRGVADGALLTSESIPGFNLQKIIKHVTEVPLGLFNTSFFLAANPAKWDQIAAADRAAIMRISGVPLGRAAGKSYDDRDAEAANMLKAEGINHMTASAAFVQELKQRLDPLETKWIEEAKSKGVDGAAALAQLRAEAAKPGN